ncbi:MAG: hypothetical protein IH598_15580 [Bacteroidales bacterium]|nr:hypothetical protein [Bacteroidales bacterium]
MRFNFYFLLVFLVCSFSAVKPQSIVLPSQNVATLVSIPIAYDGASGTEGSWIGLYPVSAADQEYLTYQYIDLSVSGDLTFEGRTETGYFNFRMFDGPVYEKIYTSEPFLIRQGMVYDAGFQSNGIFREDFLSNDLDDWAADVKIAPEQKIVVAGAAKTGLTGSSGIDIVNIIVTRFDADGQLDNFFGQNGRVITAIPGIQPWEVKAMAVQPDGKIIVGGSSMSDGGACFAFSNFFLVRYLINGDIDADFGSNGIVVTNFTKSSEPGGYSSDIFTSLVLQPDGKILAGGYGGLCAGGWGAPMRCNIARYLTNGTLDPTFGEEGKLTLFTSGINYAESYQERLEAIFPPTNIEDGSIYLAVNSGDGNFIGNKYFIYKLTMNGALDVAFGNLGVAVEDRPGTNNNQSIRSIALGPDNHLYMMGSSTGGGKIWLMKKDPVTGANISDFGDNGFVMDDLVWGTVTGNMVFFDGKIVIGHSVMGENFSAMRYNLDGTKDVEFGTPVYQIVEEGSPLLCQVNGIALQPDGKFVLAGSVNSYNSTLNDFVVMRFIENPAQLQMDSHTISLRQGWNGVSSYLMPAYNDVEEVLAIIDDEFVIMQDLYQSYYPVNNVNDIQTWNYRNGYLIKVNEDTDLIITGFKPENRSIQLQMGWNLISVLSEEPIEIGAAFGENLPFVEFMQEAAGWKVFWPEQGINTIQHLLPGKSYLVRVSDSCTISFD